MSAMTLTEFLLARIAEDEAWANRAECPCGDHERWGQKPDCPDRVLAECEANWRIVELATEGFEHNPNPTLRYLAAVYADHPDYREEWRL